MFDLQQKADAMVEVLESQLDLGTVAFIDRDDQSGRYPCTLPAAFVVMEKLGGSGGKLQSVSSDITWTIIVRAKQLSGSSGCLPVVDLVIDTLHGFRAGDNAKPLALLGAEYFEKHAESIAYAVRFGIVATGQNKNGPCILKK